MEMTESKFKVLSDIARDTAQVIFATVFLSPLLSSEPTNSTAIALGLIIAVSLWITSFLAIK